MCTLRHVTLGLLLACSLARSERSASNVTVLLDFEQTYSQTSIDEMKRETQLLLKDAGVRFDWKMQNQVASDESFDDLLMVKFKGKCVMEPAGFLYDERGPLAFTHSTNGAVLPYSEVACDKVRSSVRSAMRGGDHVKGEMLLGRALGRVLAHEIYHVLANSGGHTRDGFSKAGLSGSQLISDRIESESAVQKLKKAR